MDNNDELTSGWFDYLGNKVLLRIYGRIEDGMVYVSDYATSVPVDEDVMFLHNDINRIIKENMSGHNYVLMHEKRPAECLRCGVRHMCQGNFVVDEYQHPCYGDLTYQQVLANPYISDSEKQRIKEIC